MRFPSRLKKKSQASARLGGIGGECAAYTPVREHFVVDSNAVSCRLRHFLKPARLIPKRAGFCAHWLLPVMALAAQDIVAEDAEPRAVHITDTSLDRTPSRTAFPRYPRIARRDRIEGEATVCFKIDKHGRVHSARVASASHKIFRRPALRAMRESAFEPLAPHEVLAAGRTCRTFRFRLEPVFVSND